MKNFKKVLALVLAVVMLLSFATVASAVTSDFYEDVDDIDYKEAVDVLGAIGVLEGYPDDTFRPEKTITRAEAAKIIAMFDNKSSTINGLYASANPFSDCVDHWAESYIAYGAKTGIIAGVGGDKFAPSANVTGVQFLKMVLVVLGYDAKAEGLEGKNWDVNTLALAKRAGLTTTLGVKFDYSADLKRQEAAVIMLDALRADVVEYGTKLGLNATKLESTIKDKIENWDPRAPFEGLNVNGIVYMTVVGAVQTGDKLMKDWGLAEDVTSDAFYRPYRTWKLDGVTIGKYMFDVEAEYTSGTNLCNVFVDLGVAKTDIDTYLWIEHAVNGEMMDYIYDSHDKSADCDLEDEAIGARGTLTQVFFMGYDEDDDPVYRITEIDTWLGRVTKVTNTTTYRDGHLQSVGNVEVTVVDDEAEAEKQTYYTTEKFSKGDYVLLTYSWRDAQDYDETLGTAYTGKAGIKSLTLAKAETAALNGFSTTQTKVGADWIYNALHAYLGVIDYDYSVTAAEDTAVYQKTVGENYTFLYDTYGNVIGIVDSGIAMDYMVVDWTYLEHEAGHGVVYADVVDLNAKLTKAVVVSQYEDVGDGDDIADILNGAGGKEYGVNNTEFYDKLYYYAIDADGKYIMTAVNGDLYGAAAPGAPATAGVAILENKAYLYGTNDGEVVDWVKTVINDDTKILVHEMDGTYSATTGKDVGTIFAANAEVVMDAAGTYAEVIYLYGNVYRQSSVNTGFVIAPALPAVIEGIDGVKYCKIDVFFNGKPQTVYMDQDNYYTISGEVGFFDFRFTDVADGVIVVEVVDWGDQAADAVTVEAYAGTTLVLDDGTAYKVSPDVVIYDVDLDTAVVTEIESVGYGDEVMLQFNAAGVVVAIYNLYTEA